MGLRLGRKDAVFVASAFAFSLAVNRTLFIAPQIAMTDTQPRRTRSGSHPTLLGS
ncbi:MAG: hypothetical protein ACP5HQ_01040 [Thermoprotei archaeon]